MDSVTIWTVLQHEQCYNMDSVTIEPILMVKKESEMLSDTIIFKKSVFNIIITKKMI
jgi:hypothetical protein